MKLIEAIWSEPPANVRMQFFQNLREPTIRSGTLERLSESLLT